MAVVHHVKAAVHVHPDFALVSIRAVAVNGPCDLRGPLPIGNNKPEQHHTRKRKGKVKG